MKKCLFLILLFVPNIVLAQYRIATYNVENLFDYKHDTLHNDHEYLPQSAKQWDKTKYYRKTDNIMKVIVAMANDFEAPIIVGLCEIENDSCLYTLVKRHKYRNLGYDFVHFESSDTRGIDVALLYRTKYFKPISYHPISFYLPDSTKGREALYLHGKLKSGEELHIIQVHAPSRRGGAISSEPKRIVCAKAIRSVVDSIYTIDTQANIIIMGDFNDNPNNKAISEIIGAQKPEGEYKENELYNLSWVGNMAYIEQGTYFYSGQWSIIDQIIVSGSLLKCCISTPQAMVFHPDWLSKENASGIKVPWRTYGGDHYFGGFSDHYPTYIDLK